jgi:hypothetical protein
MIQKMKLIWFKAIFVNLNTFRSLSGVEMCLIHFDKLSVQARVFQFINFKSPGSNNNAAQSSFKKLDYAFGGIMVASPSRTTLSS